MRISPRVAMFAVAATRIAVTMPLVVATSRGGHVLLAAENVVAVERLDRLDFRNPRTWRLLKRVKIPWPGVDHLDFSADGRYLLTSTEYGGGVGKIDTVTMKITGRGNVGG